MDKKVLFTGIEIYTSAEDIATDKLFGFLEEIVSRLETDLTSDDENFQFKLQTNFRPNQRSTYEIHLNGLGNGHTREKVMNILRQTSKVFTGKQESTLQVAFDVQNV